MTALRNVDIALEAALAAGPVGKSELTASLIRQGFTEKQMRCARERLGITVKREGRGATMRSTWALPSRDIAPVAIRAPEPMAGEVLRKAKVSQSGPGSQFNAGEQTRVHLRVSRFLSRGLEEPGATALATMLVLERDRPGLRAASCAECQSCTPQGLCSAAAHTGGARDPMELWLCGCCRRDLP